MQAWLVALLILLCFQPVAHASSPAPIDIVFDIDWTTFYSVEANDPNQKNNQNLTANGKLYRPTDHLADVIETLLVKHPEVRISFFSGGERSRNEALLKNVFLSDGRSLLEISHRLLSKENLTVVSQDETLPFSTRYKKVLDQGIPDWSPQRTILIDDQVAFAKPPLIAVNSLGVYNYQNRFDASRSLELHFPVSEAQWKMERNKALLWLAMIDLAFQKSQNDSVSFSEAARSVWKKQSTNSLLIARGQQLVQRIAAPSCGKVFAF
nr:hypothetical protein [uncultured Bdellovibrio sp.]